MVLEDDLAVAWSLQTGLAQDGYPATPGLPPPHLAFSGHGVQVWQVRLDSLAPYVKDLVSMLDPDERARAARYHSSQHRAEFVIRHGLLRVILSHYLGTEPGQLQFEYGLHGRPSIAQPARGRSLHFSLSHSAGIALYAVAWERAVGVDIECIRFLSEAQQIADRFFSKRESAAFRELPDRQKLQGFFTCWTRKEAYLKATGQGLAGGLGDFSVSLVPGEPARLLEVQSNPDEIARWFLTELLPAPGYAAALCVQGWSPEQGEEATDDVRASGLFLADESMV